MQDYYSHQGDWMHIFDDAVPAAVELNQLIKNTTELTIDEVEEWIVNSEGIKGRLRFFETFAAHNTFYLKVAKPLLSMRTTGSIDVERRIKPLKHNIVTKKRNRLKDPKGVMLLRAGENLKHELAAKMQLGKKITDSL